VYVQQPRATIRLDLLTPVVSREPALAELLVRYVDHALAESTYDATLAGTLYISTRPPQRVPGALNGFSVRGGFSLVMLIAPLTMQGCAGTSARVLGASR
jgi:secreted Zn-dependent insulinase-like peptidase